MTRGYYAAPAGSLGKVVSDVEMTPETLPRYPRALKDVTNKNNVSLSQAGRERKSVCLRCALSLN